MIPSYLAHVISRICCLVASVQVQLFKLLVMQRIST